MRSDMIQIYKTKYNFPTSKRQSRKIRKWDVTHDCLGERKRVIKNNKEKTID
jgi:hypothetical protein